jgi:hypothetical protein
MRNRELSISDQILLFVSNRVAFPTGSLEEEEEEEAITSVQPNGHDKMN